MTDRCNRAHSYHGNSDLRCHKDRSNVLPWDCWFVEILEIANSYINSSNDSMQSELRQCSDSHLKQPSQ